jgi:hypothetical protein
MEKRDSNQLRAWTRDREAIREALDSDAPVASTKPPRLRVDISVMPPWRMKPVPSTTRRRDKARDEDETPRVS